MANLNLNKVLLCGRLVRDPELRVIPSTQLQVCSFTIAVNRRRGGGGNSGAGGNNYNSREANDGDDRKDEVAYIDCTAFDKKAEIISKYMAAGRQIFIDGFLRQEKWEKDGQKRSRIVVIVENFNFMDSKTDQQQGDGRAQNESEDHYQQTYNQYSSPTQGRSAAAGGIQGQPNYQTGNQHTHHEEPPATNYSQHNAQPVQRPNPNYNHGNAYPPQRGASAQPHHYDNYSQEAGDYDQEQDIPPF